MKNRNEDIGYKAEIQVFLYLFLLFIFNTETKNGTILITN